MSQSSPSRSPAPAPSDARSGAHTAFPAGNRSGARPRRTLIVGPAAIDEALLAQPLIAALRHQDSRSRIDCLAPAASAAVFRAMPQLDDVIEAPVADHQLGITARLRLARRLAQGRYDVAWVLPAARTAAIAPWLARIPTYAGRDRPPSRRTDGGRRLSTNRASLARWFASLPYAALGLPAPDPVLASRAAVLDQPPALDEATRRRLALTPGQPLFLLIPGSPYGATSRWPARQFGALAQLIDGAWPTARIAAIGGDGDRDLGAHLRLLSGGRVEDWTGLPLDRTMALMAGADGIVGSDSPLALLAAALRRPHVTLYGAGDPRAEPVMAGRREVLWLRLACSPCFDSDCRLGHTACLAGMTPEAVMAALRRASRFVPGG